MGAHHRALTGTGRYADDVSRPGQLHLAVVRSDVAHGRLLDVDVSAALALPGVVRAIVPADLEPIPRIPPIAGPHPLLDPHLQPVLADGTVRYVGQPVAAILAEDPYVAEDAAELVTVSVDPLPAVAPTEDGWESAETLIEAEGRDGPVDELFASAAHVVREELHVARRAGSPIETRGLVAEWRPDDGTLELWGPTKFIWFARGVIARSLCLPDDRVILHRVDVGGMFGVRGEVYPEDVLVAWASRACGRPVKWVEDRREHQLAMNQSPEEVHRIELALSADGDLLAYRDDVLLDVGAYARPIGARLPALVIENLPGPYRWQGVQARVTCRLSTKTPVGTVRAPTRLGSNFVRERAIDLAARQLGMDPLELRRRNLLTPGELPFRRAVSSADTLVYEGGDYPAMLDELVARAGGSSLLEDVERRRAAGEHVGVGIGAYLEGSGKGDFEGAGMTLDRSGRFRVLTNAAEVGQGLDETLRRVAAARLGVDPSLVDVDSGSSFAPDTGRGTYGSRSTVMAGSAVHGACEQLLGELAGAAAARLGADAADVELRADGAWCGSEQVPWDALAPASATFTWNTKGPAFGFGAHLVVARVDEGTGAVTLERVVAGYDCGKPIRPDSVSEQLVGGTVQGLGATLLEAVDFADGAQPVSTSFIDYLLPTCADVPRIETVTWESELTSNPLGVRGVGEAGVAGIAAAVGNAIAAALDADGPRRVPVVAEELVGELHSAAPAPCAPAPA